jgi:serralysin
MHCLYEHDHSGFDNNSTATYNTVNARLSSETEIFNSLLKEQVMTRSGQIATQNASKWTSWDADAQTTKVTFSFDGPWNQEYAGTDQNGKLVGQKGGELSELSDHNKDMVRDMLDIYAKVANVTFEETNNGTDAQMAIRMEDMSHSSVGGYAYLPGNGVGGNVTLDLEFGNIQYNSTGYFAAIHELGHAMGLYHPFQGGDPTAEKSGGISSSELNSDYSIMSYLDGASVSRKDVTGLQLYDILALQEQYGENYNHNSGDTEYVFGSYRMGEAIWDGGGNDTFKVDDNFNGNATLDLRAGDYLNTIGSAEVRIAFKAQIENAKGGNGEDNIRGNGLDNYLWGEGGDDIVHGDNGNDVIFGGIGIDDANDGSDVLLGGEGDDIVIGNGGNDTIVGGDAYTDDTDGNDTLFGGLGDDAIYGNAGNDELTGAAGTDSLYGGLGDDTYVVGWGNGADLIYGFEGAGQSGGDMIRIIQNANNNSITDFDSLMQNATDGGGHTYFDLGDGNGIVVANHSKADFDADDFDFS